LYKYRAKHAARYLFCGSIEIDDDDAKGDSLMTDDANHVRPNILVLYNENPAWPKEDRDWSQEMVDTLSKGLQEQGHTISSIKFFDDLSALNDYDPAQWLVWNWGEEIGGKPWTDAVVASELERRGFGYTGSPPDVLRMSQNRMAIKQCLIDAGLPTLPARIFTDPAEADTWEIFPAIVKGLNQHSSYGIARDSVVETPADLAARIAYMRETLNDDSLVEPFLDTREFHVAVWGNGTLQALPPLEFDYSAFSDMHDRLYTYEAKFDRHSRGFNEIRMPCPAPADRPDWRVRLEEVAVDTYRALGLRDYGRVDMRMLGDEPQVLDVNANPDIDVTSVLLTGAHVLGMNFGQVVSRISALAAQRMPAAVPVEVADY
jgi:D-alanine-D-alanine ligase